MSYVKFFNPIILFCLLVFVICGTLDMNAILDPLLLDEGANDDDIDDLMVMHILHDQELLGNRAHFYGEFNLDDYNDTLCWKMFRFKQRDIPRLARALRLPDPIVVNRVSVRKNTGLCMLLRRLAYPNKLFDLEPIFGYSSTVIGGICNFVLTDIEERWGHKLQNLGNNNFLNQNRLRQYAQAVLHKGCPLGNCWGFIDGTCRAICRPSIDQEEYYSGDKKLHCLKYQSVQCPDGIIISLKGPYNGRRHDAGILRESEFLAELQNHVVFPDGDFVLYGDEGYALHQLLLRSFTINQIEQNPARQIFNNMMKAMRVTVEWGFGKVIQLFAFLDLKKNQKLLWQEVGQMYKVATILSNCHTCLYGGNIREYFALDPPELEEYLQL